MGICLSIFNLKSVLYFFKKKSKLNFLDNFINLKKKKKIILEFKNNKRKKNIIFLIKLNLFSILKKSSSLDNLTLFEFSTNIPPVIDVIFFMILKLKIE